LEPVDFGKYLRKLRKEKKLTVRQLDLYSGVSHSYISQIERGARGIPSPEILLKLSKALNVEYEELMKAAGYIRDNKKESDYPLSEQQFDFVIKEMERRYNVNLRDDPIVFEAMKNLVESIARMKSKQ
jgi:transcriptional regulator with XRE-family HTH domain